MVGSVLERLGVTVYYKHSAGNNVVHSLMLCKKQSGYMYTDGILLSHYKEQKVQKYEWIPETVVLSEVSQDRGEEKYHDIPYMWNLRRNDTKEFALQSRLMDLGKRTCGCCWGRDS